MTPYVEQLHAIADRIGDADARIAAAQADRQAAVDELHELLRNEQPSPGSGDAGASGEEPGNGATIAEAASPTASVQCPDCEFRGRRPQGVAVHRKRRHGVPGAYHDPTRPQPKPPREAEPKVTHPSRREQYLCSRCPHGFPTVEEKVRHEAGCTFQSRPPLTPKQHRDGGFADGFGQ